MVVISEMETDSCTTVLDRLCLLQSESFSKSFNWYFLSRLTSLNYIIPCSANCPSLLQYGLVLRSRFPFFSLKEPCRDLSEKWGKASGNDKTFPFYLAFCLFILLSLHPPRPQGRRRWVTQLFSLEKEAGLCNSAPSSQPWDLPEGWKHNDCRSQ